MEGSLDKILTAYRKKARKDKTPFKQKMGIFFGYGIRAVDHRLEGRTPLSEDEEKYLLKELKLIEPF